jgi:hypothetical protein
MNCGMNCGKINYIPAATIDRDEKFLCARCDDAYLMWQNTAPDGVRRTGIDDFLKSFLALARK